MYNLIKLEICQHRVDNLMNNAFSLLHHKPFSPPKQCPISTSILNHSQSQDTYHLWITKKWKTHHNFIYDRLICIHVYLQAHSSTLYCNGTGAWFSNAKTVALTEIKQCKLLICTKNEKKLFYYMCCRIGHGMVFTELTQVINPKNVAIE